MQERLIIGNQIIDLDEIDSTNEYIKKQDVSKIEGLVVVAKNQVSGKGQHGNTWDSEGNKNLTFSVLLKPNLKVDKQFLISQLISLSIVDFLSHLKIKAVKIKWPNDIYIKDKKIAGILIENSLKSDRIYNSIVGIGININQIEFSKDLKNPTSLINELGYELDLDQSLNEMLKYIEKRYIGLKTKLNDRIISEEYHNYLYQIDEHCQYTINGEKVIGKIIEVKNSGKLQVLIDNSIQEFSLQEIKF